MTRTPTLALALLLATTTACGVQPDSSPRDVPEDNKAVLTGPSSGGVASGADRIYLVGPGEDRLLRSVSRDAASPDDLMSILLRGPNQAETNAQYASVIPPTLELLSTNVQGSVLSLDVTQELTELTGSALVLALAQIVYTASELDGVSAVKVTVENEPQAWPRGDLEFTLEPLRTYDYPSMVRTAQPAYPSVPSA